MLDKKLVADILDEALSTGGDFAEVFAEDSKTRNLALGDGKVESAGTNLLRGVGIRVFKGMFQAYAYTNLPDRESLLKTARKAAAAITGKAEKKVINLVDLAFEDKHKIRNSPFEFDRVQEADIYRKVSEKMFAASPLISRTDVSGGYKKRRILVANSDGVWAEDEQNRMRIVMSAIAVRDNLNEQASESNIGGLFGAEIFDLYNLEEIAENVVRRAVNKLDAQVCPTGMMPVVIGNEFGGVIFHEACGHSLEATSVAPGISEFSGKLGQKIASDLVTAVDDATIPNAWGSINIDDEGTPTQRKVLIENGVLKNYMVDKFGGRRMKMPSNGASRRENYKFIPTSRMSNTFILNGKSTEEEIIAATPYGLYAQKMSGGSVHPTTGEFNFSIDEAYLIENGKITTQVKGAKLIGHGADILPNIDMVGNNMAYACGMCGSISGSIPTTVGQPAIRVKELTVGGQK